MVSHYKPNQAYSRNMSEIYSQLSRPWTVSLILSLGERSTMNDFCDIQDSIRSQYGKISDSTLTRSLDELVRIGLVAKAVHEESPSVIEYGLTHAGHEIYLNILQMSRWNLEGLQDPRNVYKDISAC
ncbi:MAG: winged helix-turn-helix transcriptional regulator [Candidatus Thorarchaeota archaeon]